MDKSKMAKPGTVKHYDPYKNENGHAKLSRKIDTKCCGGDQCCGGDKCCCRKDTTGDPLSPHNPCGGGKMY